jgi:carboxymethylenebutenolidase
MDQRIIDLYDEYAHAPLDRRVFIDRLTAMVGSAALVPAILAAIEPSRAAAAQVPPGDTRLSAQRVSYPGGHGAVAGYLARPAEGKGPWPGVIVIHENRGLNAHIEDVARKLVLEGFLVLAPDLLSSLGGTPDDPDRARDLIGQLEPAAAVADLTAAMAWLKTHESGNGKAGAVGFCWGGGMVNRLAVAAPDLAGGVAYYGPTPKPEDAARIKAPLLLHYAGLDTRINEGIPAYDAALKAAGVRHEIFIYDGVNHAFNNDTSAERYDANAARLAWGRTVAFLKGTAGA